MARYYFHLFNDVSTRDEEGAECADLDGAHKRGVAEARNSAAHSIVDHGHLILDHRIEIADKSGSVVDTIAFGDAIEVRRSSQ